jgi:hypothetical protein
MPVARVSVEPSSTHNRTRIYLIALIYTLPEEEWLKGTQESRIAWVTWCGGCIVSENNNLTAEVNGFTKNLLKNAPMSDPIPSPVIHLVQCDGNSVNPLRRIRWAR